MREEKRGEGERKIFVKGHVSDAKKVSIMTHSDYKHPATSGLPYLMGPAIPHGYLMGTALPAGIVRAGWVTQTLVVLFHLLPS